MGGAGCSIDRGHTGRKGAGASSVLCGHERGRGNHGFRIAERNKPDVDGKPDLQERAAAETADFAQPSFESDCCQLEANQAVGGTIEMLRRKKHG